MESVHFALMALRNEKCTVQSAPARLPRRKPNAEYRSREHLTEQEVERLIEAAKGNRWGCRDTAMVLHANEQQREARTAKPVLLLHSSPNRAGESAA